MESRFFAALFEETEGVYENPPSNEEYFFKPFSFTWAEPQSAPNVNFINIDISLVHKKFLSNEEKEDDNVEKEDANVEKEDDNVEKEDGNVEREDGEISSDSAGADRNVKGPVITVKQEVIDPVNTNEISCRKDMELLIRGEISKKDLLKDGADSVIKENECPISQKEDFAVSTEMHKKGKHKSKSKGKKKKDIDYDVSKNGKQKHSISKSTGLESISKSYSISEPDSDGNERHRTESPSHHKKSHSKKSSHYRREDRESRNEASSSDGTTNEVGLRRVKSFVKQHISSDEEYISSSLSKRNEATIEEVLSDKNKYRKDKKKSSEKSKKKKHSKRHKDSITHDDGRNFDKSLSSTFTKKVEITVKGEVLSEDDDDREKMSSKSSKKKHSSTREDSRSPDYPISHGHTRRYDDSKNHEQSRRHEDSRSADNYRRHDDSRSSDNSRRHYDSRSPDDYRRNHSDHLNDGNLRSQHYEDSNGSIRSSYLRRDIKTEIKQEFAPASDHGPNDFYCDICNLDLNSDITFNTHIAGKKHKKALRSLHESLVAQASAMEIKSSLPLSFPRSPDMERIELFGEVSNVQEVCEDIQLLIVGLNFVKEIRGYEDTKYLCDLCEAQCVANTIIKHLSGYKHLLNCFKEYSSRCYENVKSKYKGEVEKVMRSELFKVRGAIGIGRIRVFKDVQKRQRSPKPFDPYQPSTSRQTPVPGNEPNRNTGEPRATDEKYLSRESSDFFCTICRSHINNYATWENHVRGKKHVKNKRKVEEGGVATETNYIEAPEGTISHLCELIERKCNHNDIIVGLKFIQESQGDNGNLYNCFLCGSVCSSADVINHLKLTKHKEKYLSKMLIDGDPNNIESIKNLHLSGISKEVLINTECLNLLKSEGRGRPKIVFTKRTYS